MKNMESGC